MSDCNAPPVNIFASRHGLAQPAALDRCATANGERAPSGRDDTAA
jgi:hypothetical protein